MALDINLSHLAIVSYILLMAMFMANIRNDIFDLKPNGFSVWKKLCEKTAEKISMSLVVLNTAAIMWDVAVVVGVVNFFTAATKILHTAFHTNFFMAQSTSRQTDRHTSCHFAIFATSLFVCFSTGFIICTYMTFNDPQIT